MHSRRLALVAVPLVAAVVLLGVWVTGGLVTQDEAVAMKLTAAWFAVGGVVAVLIGLRWRGWAPTVVGTWLVTALAAGGFLFWTSHRDTVVHEDVVAVASAAPTAAARTASGAAAASTAAASPSAAPAAGAPSLVSAGSFTTGAHPTRGKARLIDLADGSRVLTLTSFGTDPGPDVRVYLVAGDGSSVDGAVDLGGLKGNKGDQQYAVPAGAPSGAVVLWCRAFSVAFGTAALTT